MEPSKDLILSWAGVSARSSFFSADKFSCFSFRCSICVPSFSIWFSMELRLAMRDALSSVFVATCSSRIATTFSSFDFSCSMSAISFSSSSGVISRLSSCVDSSVCLSCASCASCSSRSRSCPDCIS